MTEQVTYISSFQFNTLRKYMHSLYATLNHNIEASDERKREFIRELVPQFFYRMRTHRQIQLEDLAKTIGVTVDHLQQFEEGKIRADKKIEDGYCRTCGGHDEKLFFSQQLQEFMNPSIKEDKDRIAMAALRQYGLVMAGVDYKNTCATKGAILTFPSQSTRNSK